MKTARLYIIGNWENHGQALTMNGNTGGIGFFFQLDKTRPFRKFQEYFVHLKARIHENS